jgi:cytochrome c6
MQRSLVPMSYNPESLLKQITIILLIAVSVLTITFSPSALAADTANGAKIFSAQCAGCHINGGNIVRRGKTLKQKALKRNGVDSLEAIASLVANGKNNMSAYKDRLTEQQIEDVSVYVLEQADKGWR